MQIYFDLMLPFIRAASMGAAVLYAYTLMAQEANLPKKVTPRWPN